MAYYTLVVETAVFFSPNGPADWPFPLQKHQRMSLILVARYWFTNLKYIFNNEILLYFDVSFLLWIFEVFLKHLIFLTVKNIIHITDGIQSLNFCICFLTVKELTANYRERLLLLNHTNTNNCHWKEEMHGCKSITFLKYFKAYSKKYGWKEVGKWYKSTWVK